MAKAKKEQLSELAVIGPKVPLDEEILAEINRHYAARLGVEVLNRECFSDPKLDSHICSVRAKAPGGDVCKSCGNIDGRPCKITCHVHHFCLATFATRLGIGVTKKQSVVKHIKHNLSELTYGELYDLVQSRKALCEASKPSDLAADPPKDRAQTDLDLPVVPSVEKKPSKPEAPFDKDLLEAEGLITIKAAAELFGCTYMNMAGHIRRGNIGKVEKYGSTFLRKADVLSLKERTGKAQ